jgi:hypothetical protein
MTKDEALKLALEALERCVATCFDPYAHEQAMSGSEHFVNQTITAIKKALANEALDKMAENARELGLDYEPAQEPVSQPKVRTGNCLRVGVCASEGHKIQPQRTWVGLTDIDYAGLPLEQVGLVRWAEAKLKEKNCSL